MSSLLFDTKQREDSEPNAQANSKEDTKSEVSESQDHRRVVVGNLAYSVTERQLREFISKWGAIETLYIPMKRNRSKGLAIVDFERVEDAERFVEEQNQKEIFDRKCYLSFGDKDHQIPTSSNKYCDHPRDYRPSPRDYRPRRDIARRESRRTYDDYDYDYVQRRRPSYHDRDDYSRRYDRDFDRRSRSYRDKEFYRDDRRPSRDYYRPDTRRPRDRRSSDDYSS